MQSPANLLRFDIQPDSYRPCQDDEPSWEITRAIHSLRLTIADACLRAREEARQHQRDRPEYWAALGSAHGYQIATTTLRGWIRPDMSTVCMDALTQQLNQARQSQRKHQPYINPSQAFYDAYAWTLGWVMTQVHELC